MPLFTSLPTPWALLPDDREAWSSATSAILTANATYIQAARLDIGATLTGFRTRFTAGTAGNYDVGLYDASGNRLTHTGIIATATGIQTANLGTALPLSPGRYYLAFWIDNATDTVRQSSTANGLSLTSFAVTGVGGLPATVTPPLGSLGIAPGVIGLLSGGWS